MFELKALQVSHGDALIVSYGEETVRHIMIDGGPSSTVGTILNMLEYLRINDCLRIELLVVSHYDLDHIGGILELLRSAPSWLSIGDIWFNGRRHSSPGDALGTCESDDLSEILGRGMSWNRAFDGGPVVADPDRWIGLDGGLNLLILSPTANELAVVGREWDDEKHKCNPSSAPTDMLGRSDCWPAPHFATVKRDGLRIDSSPANGSSIALLLEYKKTKILLAADAFSEVISDSLSKLNEQPVEVSLLKLSHHGSQGNTSAALLRAISCKKFLFSTDGSIHRHPDQALVARILDKVMNPEFIFNYNNPHTLHWQTPPKGWPRYVCQFPRWNEPFVRVSLSNDP
jgi:hypothetical protein